MQEEVLPSPDAEPLVDVLVGAMCLWQERDLE